MQLKDSKAVLEIDEEMLIKRGKFKKIRFLRVEKAGNQYYSHVADKEGRAEWRGQLRDDINEARFDAYKIGMFLERVLS